MYLVDLCLLIINICFLCWIVHLKREINKLAEKLNRQPAAPSLRKEDLQRFQASIAEIIQDIESYSEANIQRMKIQVKEVNDLYQKMEHQLRQRETIAEVPPAPAPQSPHPSEPTTRIVPLASRQSSANHKDRDKIIDLYRKGWTMDKIAEELRITKGEVQLIVNLS